jgi:release factor glutamine methyltransferase
MTLVQIKTIYLNRLSAVYPQSEIDSIFSLICLDLLNYSKIDIHSKKEISISKEIENKFLSIADRLLEHEPIQYILGTVEFYNLNLKIDRRALIPRPETELLVDIIVKDFSGRKNLKIIDMCTGSGCIALALGGNLNKCNLTATDISNDALSLAQSNADKLKIEINFIGDSVLHPQCTYDTFDLIVSNPPYVRDSEIKLMEKNVLEYEPHLALFVNDNEPLVFYQAIARFGVMHLSQDGMIYCEINEALGKETTEIFMSQGFNKTIVMKDLNNKDRFIKASRI